LLRTGETSGFHCDAANFSLCLKAALDKQEKPSTLMLSADHDMQLPADLPMPVQLTLLPLAEMRYLQVKQAHLSTPLNLLSGEFRQRKRSTLKLFKQPWLKVGLIAWAVLMVLYPFVSWQLLSSRANDLHEAMLAIYHRHFPETLQMIAPRERMEERLHQYAGGGSNHAFFNILMRVSRALHQANGIQLKRLDYQNQFFTLAVTAQSTSAFSDWVRALQSQGLRVKQQNAELQGERINATVMVQ
jgi:type II secretion system protein L